MSTHIRKSHNTNLILFHLVCPAKRRRKVFLPEVEKELKSICIEISECYEVIFVEIGTDEDHVNFLIQIISPTSATSLAKLVKSITAKKLLAKFPWIKTITLGNHLWTSGYYIASVGVHGNEVVISNYVKQQGKKYTKIHRAPLGLFDGYA